MFSVYFFVLTKIQKYHTIMLGNQIIITMEIDKSVQENLAEETRKDRQPGPDEEYVWERVERKCGLSVSDWKTRDVWGGEIVKKEH